MFAAPAFAKASTYFSGSTIIRWQSSGSFGVPLHRRDHRRSPGEVRHEAAVHHVDVDPVGARLLHRPDLLADARQIAGEQRRRDRAASVMRFSSGARRRSRRCRCGAAACAGSRGRDSPPGKRGGGASRRNCEKAAWNLVHLLVALFGRERAEREDQHAAGLHVALHRREQPRLQLREAVDVVGRPAQLHLRMAAQRAEAGAGRVEQHQIEASLGDVRNAAARRRRPAPADSPARGAGPLPRSARLAGVEIDGEHRAAIGELREMARLPTRRRAGVEHPRLRSRRGEQGDQLRRLVLGLEQALLRPPRCPARAARPPRGSGRRGCQRPGRDSIPAFCSASCAWATVPAPRDANRCRRLLLVGRAELLRIGRPSQRDQRSTIAARMRAHARHVTNRNPPRARAGRAARASRRACAARR